MPAGPRPDATGAALIFARRAFHSVRSAPFRVSYDHFQRAPHRPSDIVLSFDLGGHARKRAKLLLIRAVKRSPDQMEASGGVTVLWR